MTFLYNTHLQPDGTLPPEHWVACEADDEMETLQIACRVLTLADLPCTVHIANTKHMYPNGVPMMTKGFDIAVTDGENTN